MDEVIKLLKQAIKLLEQEKPPKRIQEDSPATLAWGAKVSSTFRDRVRWIAETLEFNPDWLMAVIAWESAETFRPDIKNMAGSGATGLIQFMPSTAENLNTSVEELAQVSAEDQLRWVYKYFRPYAGRINNLGDLYMAVLWPRGVGKSESYVLWDKNKRPTTYRQNAGLDKNKDGRITRAECTAKILDKLAKGLQPENVA